jgi:hypothetical protein
MIRPKWTTAKPTQPGWYWYRQGAGGEIIVSLHQYNDSFIIRFSGNGQSFDFDEVVAEYPGAEWAGPLEKP